MSDKITIKGAREHNLKGIDLEIPRDKLVVITGLSGSGKSSLAFDTIYAEGQRRYVESLSAYARQFLGLMEKPDVDSIDGLSPAISIDQKSSSRNPRSTVGTITEIYDYLRVLYARAGTPHCPICGDVVSKQTVTTMVDKVLEMKEGQKIVVLSPVIRDKKGEHRYVFDELKKAGYVRVRVDKKIYDIDEHFTLDKHKKHNIDVIIDRLVISDTINKRLAESIENALNLGDGLVIVQNIDSGVEQIYSEHFACLKDEVNLSEISPRSFSFNSPHGACTHCTGLGTTLEVDADLVMPNPRLTLSEGGIRPWARTTSKMAWYLRVLEAVGEKFGFDTDTPVGELNEKQKKVVLYGTGEDVIDVKVSSRFGGNKVFKTTYEGVVANLARRYKETDSDYVRKEIERYMTVNQCPVCAGKRLKPEALAVTIDDYSITDMVDMTILDAVELFKTLKLDDKQQFIGRQLLKEIQTRLSFLQDVGLGYLSLDRSATTLSGGEAQRIRLATQIGSSLMGVIYILDEPSIGLHQKDNVKLIATLKRLRDLGNSVIVVEHDRETMESADYLIDIGPGAGEHGGHVVAVGTPAEVLKNKNSLTGAYLSGAKRIDIPMIRRKGSGKNIEIIGARENNLKNISVKIPLGMLVSVTGVSGSGKSTLINDILAKKLSQVFHRAQTTVGKHTEIKGVNNLDKVINIDQSPIGRTPRSNPVTYTGIFTDVRDLFAATPEARIRGYKVGRFSFNVKGGRCEMCKGDGIIKIEMHFLPDVYVTCEDCKGKRYNREALEIHYKGKNISDVLNMTVEEALAFFENIPQIERKLRTLVDVGLNYIKLGQPATTLSGGEAQRVKLAAELSRKGTGKTLYILDEPTTGLHFDDVKRLLAVLHQLVAMGNSVLIIEHNLDVIASCDHVIDLGPEGGDAGGKIVAQGTPETISVTPESSTGKFLKDLLKTVKKNRPSGKKIVEPVVETIEESATSAVLTTELE